ncbi:hypothetical protein GHT09_003953 [Marmota monax]|uniref:LanC-like protein 2 n=1 Tax=Marmota monax TaxID=9995 RepID=A0A834UM93_MARMO|nr:hypothetical protein GHT09_003953 [Marmota monax]
MGETMSKRLKLHLGGEAEMEERAFTNPFPDYEAALAAAGLTTGTSEESGCVRTQSTTDELGLPFHHDGKIIHNFVRRIQTKIKDLLQQMEEGLKTADPHDCSAYTGWTGIALLYLQLYRVTCDQTYLLRSLDYVVNAIIESGKTLSREERKTDRCPLLYQWHRKQYVGAAHGMSGIYYMLMQPAAKVDQETLIEMVKPSIDYVRHKKFRSGNYPSSLSNETDRLVHWCHGAPGVIHMLMQAYKVFKEEKYLKEAMECSDVIWHRGLLRKGYGICHGTSGNGYSFLSLYHVTKDKKYLYRACKFAEWCLDYGAHGCRIPDRPYSLFEGMAGAIHFLSDILVPETSRFPAFELGISQRN